MAKFVNTRKAAAAIDEIIRKAEERLILISPYLKLSNDFRELLEFRNNKNKCTTIIFGKQELNPDEMKFLEGLRFIELKYYHNLHAKCYLNEKQMVITSLNLYDFSMVNNKEMGVLLDLNDPNDKDLYNDAWSEIELIDSNSERFEFTPDGRLQKSSNSKQEKKVVTKKRKKHEKGKCIRCSKDIKLDPLAPLCLACYRSWNKYGNEEHPEIYCHVCGIEHQTSFLKPTCYTCFKANKNKLEFSI